MSPPLSWQREIDLAFTQKNHFWVFSFGVEFIFCCWKLVVHFGVFMLYSIWKVHVCNHGNFRVRCSEFLPFCTCFSVFLMYKNLTFFLVWILAISFRIWETQVCLFQTWSAPMYFEIILKNSTNKNLEKLCKKKL